MVVPRHVCLLLERSHISISCGALAGDLREESGVWCVVNLVMDRLLLAFDCSYPLRMVSSKHQGTPNNDHFHPGKHCDISGHDHIVFGWWILHSRNQT